MKLRHLSGCFFFAKKKVKTIADSAGTCLLRAQLMPSPVSFHHFFRSGIPPCMVD